MSLRELLVLGTSSQAPTQRRNHNGYLLRWDGEGFLFDPGEGTQRQFIFAKVSPTAITKIFISHFHGDHCLGLAGLAQRLSLDRCPHPVEVYFPKSGERFYHRLVGASSYVSAVDLRPCPVSEEGRVYEDDALFVEARRLDHSLETFGFRVQEHDQRRFDKERLAALGLQGPLVGRLQREGVIPWEEGTLRLEDVSYVQRGASFAYVLDTRRCENAIRLAREADLLLCEATYGDEEAHMAEERGHLTARQAGEIAAAAGARALVLTHFSQRYGSVTPLVREARSRFPNTEAARDLRRFSLRREEPEGEAAAE